MTSAINLLSEFENLSQDSIAKITSYLGREWQKIPVLSKKFQKMFQSDLFWEKLVKIHFPSSIPQNTTKSINYKKLGNCLLLKEAIFENICSGRYTVSKSERLKWGYSPQKEQCAILREQKYAQNENLGITVETTYSTKDGKHILRTRNRSDPSKISYTISAPHDLNPIEEIQIQGNWIVTRAIEGIIKVWDLKTGTLMKSFSDSVQSEITALCLDQNRIYAGNSQGDILMWNFTDQTGTKPTVLQYDLNHPVIASIVKLNHWLIIGRKDKNMPDVHSGKINVIDLRPFQKESFKCKTPEMLPIQSKTIQNTPINSLAICPITHVLFVAETATISAWEVELDGKLKHLHSFPRSRKIQYMKAENGELTVAFTRISPCTKLTEKEIKWVEEGRESTFNFSTPKDNSLLLDLAREYSLGEFPHLPYERFQALPRHIKKCIYTALDSLMKEKNPSYRSPSESGKFPSWEYGLLAFDNKLNTRDIEPPIQIPRELRPLAIEKAYEELQKVETGTLKQTEVLTYLMKLGIGTQAACSKLLEVRLTDFAKYGLSTEADLKALNISLTLLNDIARLSPDFKSLQSIGPQGIHDCHLKMTEFISDLTRFIQNIQLQETQLRQACRGWSLGWITNVDFDQAEAIQKHLEQLAVIHQELTVLLGTLNEALESPVTLKKFLDGGLMQILEKCQAKSFPLKKLISSIHIQVLNAYLKQYDLHLFYKEVKKLRPGKTFAQLLEEKTFLPYAFRNS